MCSVEIAIMHNPTGATAPFSYPQLTQSTRPCPCKAGRASQTGAGFVDFAISHAKPVGFVSKHGAKLTPSRVQRGFGHKGFDHLRTGHIADHNQPGTVDNGRRGFMCPVCAGVGNTRMDGLDALLLVGTLRQGQGMLMRSRHILSGVRRRLIRARPLVLQAQINPDLARSQRDPWRLNLALNVYIPAAPCILGKAPSLGRALDGTRCPEPIAPLAIGEALAVELEKPEFEGHPAERPLAAPPLQAAFLGCKAFGNILPADFADRIAMQAQFPTGASREVDQVHRCQDALVTAQRQHADVIAEVPHGIAGPRQPLQVLAFGGVLHAVFERQHATRHGVALAPQYIALWSQQRHGQRYRNSMTAPRTDLRVCVYASRERSTVTAAQKSPSTTSRHWRQRAMVEWRHTDGRDPAGHRP